MYCERSKAGRYRGANVSARSGAPGSAVGLEKGFDGGFDVRRPLADFLSEVGVQKEGFEDSKSQRQKVCPIKTSDKLFIIARAGDKADDLASRGVRDETNAIRSALVVAVIKAQDTTAQTSEEEVAKTEGMQLCDLSCERR